MAIAALPTREVHARANAIVFIIDISPRPGPGSSPARVIAKAIPRPSTSLRQAAATSESHGPTRPVITPNQVEIHGVRICIVRVVLVHQWRLLVEQVVNANAQLRAQRLQVISQRDVVV